MRRSLLTALAASLLFVASGLAQTTGSIEGWVYDSAGALLPGVAVEASGANLQGRRSAVTAKDGIYRLPRLPPGRYVVRASLLPNFASVEKTVDVAVDAASIVKIILQLALSEQAFVSAATPFVDTTSTTTGTTYNSRVAIHLPFDRNYADAAHSNPGVVEDRGDQQGRSLALAVDGATSAENGWVIDGIDTTNVMKGVQGKAINSEFVEELEVKTGGYQAEYGRSLGGVINVVTKSGGNSFHGGAFVYYDSASLRARRVFSGQTDSTLSGMRVADYSRTDYGFDLGGYVVRDRLWFFGAYNRTDFPAAVSRYVPSDLVPTTMEFPMDGTDTLYSAKVTWNLAVGSTLVGTVFGDPTTNSGAGASDPRQTSFRVAQITNPDPSTWSAERSIGAADFGLRGSQVLGSSAFLSILAARHQDRYLLNPTGSASQVRLIDRTCQDGTRLHPCDIPSEPNFVEGGFGNLGGPGNNSSSKRDQLRTDANFYRGRHEVQVGADYQKAHTNALGLYSGGQQVYRFNEYGETYYLHEFYSSAASGLTPATAVWVATADELGAYAQDSWKATAGVTVNVGLRWDQEHIQQRGGSVRVRLNDEWQPRVGVVWDPWRDGATKIFAFAGRFYHALSTELVARTWGSPVVTTTYNFDRTDVTPAEDVFGHTSSIGGPGSPTPPGQGLPVDSGLKGISLDEFTFGAERLLGSSFSIGLKATYRRLHNTIEDRCDADNSRNPGCGYMNPGGSGQYARGDIYWCNGFDSEWSNCNPDRYVPMYPAPAIPPARRLYRGIELLARKSFSERLWFQGSYVYSSLRGNYDGIVSEGFQGETNPGFNPDFDFWQLTRDSYGRLYLDRPHDLRLTGFYMTPFSLSVGLQAYLLSGPPLDKLGYLNQTYYYGVHLVPRGDAGRMPTQWDASLTLEYPVRLGPATVTLQGFLYNIFNNQIPTDQDMVWSNQRPEGYPDTIFDPNQTRSNENYGKATSRQSPRLFRAAVRVSF
jgi:hypothetical protein